MPNLKFRSQRFSIFETINSSVGNQIVGFNSPFQRKKRVCNIALLKKNKDTYQFSLDGGQICSTCWKNVSFFIRKVSKSLSIIVFKEYCVCLILLIFIFIKFCKIFYFRGLYATPGYWAIDQLVFSIGAIRGLTRSSKIRSRQWQSLFY